jgi:hypothetical protein
MLQEEEPTEGYLEEMGLFWVFVTEFLIIYTQSA